MSMHPVLASAFDALNKSSERWLLLRGEEDLDRPEGDVDLLVSQALLPQLDELMRGLGLHRVVASGRGTHRFYLTYDAASDLWLKLDVVSDVAFGPLQQWTTPLAEDCLERRVSVGALWLPEPGDQAWLYLLHLVLDKGQITEDRQQLALAAGARVSSGGPIPDYLDGRAGAGTAARLLDVVNSGRFALVAGLAHTVKAGWTRSDPGSTWATLVKHRVQRLASPTLQGRARRGLMMAVMGPDGAGKTTVLRAVGAEFPIPAKYVYMGLWAASAWDSRLARLPGGRLGQKTVRIIRGAAISRYHYARGRLVLLDRVAYDAKLPGSVDNTLGGRITQALLVLAPRPDVLLVLDAPGSLMFARKGEHSVEILDQWRREYLELGQDLGARILDASEPADQVRRRAVEIAWVAFVGGSGRALASTTGQKTEQAA